MADVNVQTLTIVSGAITLTGSSTGSGLYAVNTEGAAATDDLTAILGGSDYAMITLSPAVAGQYFTLVHNGTSIRLLEDFDFVPQSTTDFITLRANSDGSVWREETRGRFP
jgi:hypothetical protein